VLTASSRSRSHERRPSPHGRCTLASSVRAAAWAGAARACATWKKRATRTATFVRAACARATVTLSLALTITLVPQAAWAPPAAAWANGDRGGNGFGTHDWVLQEAYRLARDAGCRWLRLPVALKHTDDPDTRLHDYYHHIYDVWGGRYGDAPDRVAQLFARAVRQLDRGSPRRASITFGLLAHYYADVCNPMHTGQSTLEERIHSSYEDAVDWRTDTVGKNRAWVRAGTVKARRSAAAATRSAAARAHVSYRRLVRQYAAHGYNGRVSAITRQCLRRAAHDLAALLLSVQQATR